MKTAQPFHIPQDMSVSQQRDYCLSIIQKLRGESTVLREERTYCTIHHNVFDEIVQHWKNKYQKEHEEKEKIKEDYQKLEEDYGRLKKEKDTLAQQLDEKIKTTNRLIQALFLHGNFKKKSPGLKKTGGQIGHKDTNQDKNRDYASLQKKRVFATHCGNCGTPLPRVKGSKAKILIDILVSTQLVQLLLESERQWCPNCQKEINARHPQTLPFTEYGLNTFMIIMVLRFRGNASARTITEILKYCFGLDISESVVLSILAQAKEYLQGKYDKLQEAVRKGHIMYSDETGWLIKGDKAWMWIMATADTKDSQGNLIPGKTVYVAAETKGKGVFEEMYGNSSTYCMHDGNPSYVSVTGEKFCLYCWAHVIRFAFEETVKLTPEHLACHIRDSLVELYLTIRKNTQWSRKEKEIKLRESLENILATQSANITVNKILFRIGKQKEGLILALLLTEDGTNNLAEREFRKLVISRYISHGSASFEGMVTTAVLASIIQTLHRDKNNPLLPTLNSYMISGIEEKYPQYKHPSSFDP
jgi:hypothetical protein